MGIDPASLSRRFPGPTGDSKPSLESLARSLAISLDLWTPTLVLHGSAWGQSGSGIVFGTLTVSDPKVSRGILAGKGPLARSIQAWVTDCAVWVYNGLPYRGTSAVVSSGSDVSEVSLKSETALASILRETHREVCRGFGSSGGSLDPDIYTGIAESICAVLDTAIGRGSVTPTVPSPTPVSITGPTVSYL